MTVTKPSAFTSLDAIKKGLPCGRLTIKIANSDKEREQVFRLRYEVFNKELGEGLPESVASGLDQDEYDKACDHLMVMSGEDVIGTYRLLYGPESQQGFYSETEFDLSANEIDFHQAVELGRGCIHQDYRKQSTLMALFWALYRYMKARNARYLFGCASLPIMGENDAEAVYEQLKREGHLLKNTKVKPLDANYFKGDAAEGLPQIPPLISFYLDFGAKVFGRPAYDPVFGCFDLLMHFDMESLSPWGTELLRRFDKRLNSNK